MKKILIIIILCYSLPFYSVAQSWPQLGNDIVGEAAGDNFGFAASLDAEGNTIAIGAHRNDGNGNDSGHLRVLDWNGSNWVQRGLDIDGAASGDDFGHKVCISGDGNIVVGGAQWNGTNGIESGHARVFAWETNKWTQMGSDLNGVASGDYFGQSVRLSNNGHIVAVAGSGFYGDFSYEGVIRIYSWNGIDWEQMGSDIVGGANYDAMNNCDLSFDGLTVAAGSPKNNSNADRSGQVRVFTWDGQSWVQKGSSISGENTDDELGNSVRLSADGNIIAMGAPYGDGNEENAGYVKVFRWDGTNWLQMGQSIYGEAEEDHSGYRIGLNRDGSKLIIGALRNDGNGGDSGHARVYKFENLNWVQDGEDIDGMASGDLAGFDVDINDMGNIITVGARNNNDNGHVRVFGELVSNLIETMPINEFNIFPNPTIGHVNIKLKEGSNATIKVLSIDGKVLYFENNIHTTLHKFQLDVTPGLYIVEISSNSKTKILKLVKK